MEFTDYAKLILLRKMKETLSAEGGYREGMCLHLQNALCTELSLHIEGTPRNFLNTLYPVPELLEFKPYYAEGIGYWWPRTQEFLPLRLNAVDTLIERFSNRIKILEEVGVKVKWYKRLLNYFKPKL